MLCYCFITGVWEYDCHGFRIGIKKKKKRSGCVYNLGL